MGTVEKVSVVAGGYSVRSVDTSRLPGHVIAVNDSAVYLPRWDACVSMDRLWSENRAQWLLENAGDRPLYFRASAFPAALLERPNTHRYNCDHTSVYFGPTPMHLNGTNSGYVALNLAYTMRPRELYLFGFDMQRGPNNEAHWYPDYPWNPKASSSGKLNEWSRQFDTVAQQFRRQGVKVFNVSDRSLLQQFPLLRSSQLGEAA
jgi:hypothetical protein